MSDYAVIIAARMKSERLPGKALCSYSPDGRTNLDQIVSRWRASRHNPAVVVMTTTQPEDDAIDRECRAIGVMCARGPEDDPLSNMDAAACAHAPEYRWIARGLADNPLVDVGLADWRLDVLKHTGADGLHYGKDHEHITYAGTTDVWSREAWDAIAAESSGEQRLHPGLYYWDNMSKFDNLRDQMPGLAYMRPLRTELDTTADLAVFSHIWRAWYEHCGWLPPKARTAWEHSGETISDTASGSIIRLPSGAVIHVSERPSLALPREVPTAWALDWLTAHPEVSALNSGVELKTQSKPRWKKGSRWECENCGERMGAIVNDALSVNCEGCGEPRKFYVRAPENRRAG